MSSNAQILRNLVINSPQDLYKILKQVELNSSLVPFMDRMDIFINGCTCDAEENWDKVVTEYIRMKINDLSCLKENYNLIIFNLDSETLFEI